MIITADWVAPVSHPPIREGAVVVNGRKISDVGIFTHMRRSHPDDPVHAHPGCVIVPGLVNAHTHLSLTALAGLVPPMHLTPWLTEILPLIRSLTHDDLAVSASMGALHCLMTGATVVGDETVGPEGLSAAGDQGLAGVFFWEVYGLAPLELPASLARREFPEEQEACGEGRLQCALSAYAPYVCGPGLIEAVHELTRSRGCRMMMHLAESPAEIRLLASGEGSLAPFAAQLARNFEPPHMGAVHYADSLGVLEDTIAVHCVHLASGEADLLASKARGVVLCPGSNRYLHNGEPPVALLRTHGARMAIGTDSLARNDAVDLFAEARLLRSIDPGLSPNRLLEMLTLEGASVLGLDRLLGSIEPDKQADLAIIEIGRARDPVERLIESGSPARVQAVMSLGTWRILGNRPTGIIDKLMQENAEVTAKVSRSRNRATRVAERRKPSE